MKPNREKVVPISTKTEQEKTRLFQTFRRKDTLFEVLESTPDMVKFRLSSKNDPDNPLDTTGKYERTTITEIEGPFFVKDKVTTDPKRDGALPHGSACYIHEWDIILVQPEVIEERPLTKEAFTILVHELGHRASYHSNPRSYGRDYYVEEWNAWKHCQLMFATHPLLDQEEVTQHLEELKNRIRTREQKSDVKN